MKRNLLLTPGPTQIPTDIGAALGQPIIHHRTPQFREQLKEAIEGLQYVLQTENDVYLLASSGTGAMEAAVANLLSPGDRAITVDGGKFGARWRELCQAYGVVPDVIQVEWGKAVEPTQIENRLTADKEIKAVFVTLCETSTGVTSDIQSIAHIVKKTDAVLVVDGISGIGVVDFRMDAWGVDVAISSSQKGFMLPPGISIISANEKAFKLIETSKSPRYYLDLRKYKAALERNDTPFTPATGIVLALNESLKTIKQRGLENVCAYYARLAKGVRAAAQALGLTIFTDESCRSNALTVINMPEGIDGSEVVKIMRNSHEISIAGGQAQFKGKIIRIAHMGSITEQDILNGISSLEETLHKLGYPFKLGAGLNAAQEVFDSANVCSTV